MQELKQYRLETSQQWVMASEEETGLRVHLAPAVETSYVKIWGLLTDEANHLAAAC